MSAMSRWRMACRASDGGRREASCSDESMNADWTESTEEIRRSAHEADVASDASDAAVAEEE